MNKYICPKCGNDEFKLIFRVVEIEEGFFLKTKRPHQVWSIKCDKCKSKFTSVEQLDTKIKS